MTLAPAPALTFLEWTGHAQVLLQALALVAGGSVYVLWTRARQRQHQSQELHVHGESFGRDDVVGETDDG